MSSSKIIRHKEMKVLVDTEEYELKLEEQSYKIVRKGEGVDIIYIGTSLY